MQAVRWSPGSRSGPPGGRPWVPTHLPCAPTSGTGTAVSPPRPHCRSPQDTGRQAARARFFGLPPHPESTPGRGRPPDGRGVAEVSWDRSLAGDTAGKNTTHLQAHEGVLGLTADSQEGKEECRAFSVEKAGLPDVRKFPRESQTSGQVTWSLTACQLSLRRAVSSLLSPVSLPWPIWGPQRSNETADQGCGVGAVTTLPWTTRRRGVTPSVLWVSASCVNTNRSGWLASGLPICSQAPGASGQAPTSV